VATLGATLAYDLLVVAQRDHGVVPVTYEDDVHPYSDLALGRVDAVLLVYVWADRGVRRNPGLMNQPMPVGVGHYVGILAPEHAALRDQMNEILKQAMRDGRLQAIFRKWNMWNEDQTALYARLVTDSQTPPETASTTATTPHVWEAARLYRPARFRAAGITVLLSVLSMLLAVALGVVIATGRVYGSRPVEMAL